MFIYCFVFSQDLQQDNDDPLKKLGQSTQKIVQCRICKGDHWTTKCPYKDQLEVIQAQVKEDEAAGAAGAGNDPESYCIMNCTPFSPMPLPILVQSLL